MRAPKQHDHIRSTLSVSHRPVVGIQQKRSPTGTPTARLNPVVQRLSQVGSPANVSTHAALLNRAPAHQVASNRHLLSHLQRHYGNPYVNQVVKLSRQQNGTAPAASTNPPRVQPRLMIGPVGDKYEREADQVASQVVQQINTPTPPSASQSQSAQRQVMPEALQTKPQITAIQRQAMPGEKEEDEKHKLTKKKLETAAQHQKKKQEEDKKHKTVQEKLAKDTVQQHKQLKEEEKHKLAKKKSGPEALHSPHKKLEEEEDKRLAQKKATAADHFKKPDEEDDKRLAQKKPAMDTHSPPKEREDEDELHHAQMKAVMQRLSTGGETATADVESSVKQARGQGRPLPEQFRGQIEQAFGVDFSGVRIHTGDHADRLNQAVQARAFTTGQDIFLRQGEYALGSQRGQELLAHELTHVVQQSGGAVRPKAIAQVTKKANKIPSNASPATVSGREAAILQSNGQAPSAPWADSAILVDASEPEAQPQPVAAEVRGGETTVQRQAAGDAAPDSPEDDPAYQDVVSQAHDVTTKEKDHQPAKEKSQEAQAAAKPPSNEVESKAQDKQVDEMEQAPTPPFDAKAFKEALLKRIADITPKTLEEADQFKGSNKLESVKHDVTGKVDKAQKDSQGPLDKKTKATPDTSGITPKSVTPLPPNQPGETPSIGGAEKAAPKAKGQSEVEAPAQARSQSLDQQLAAADITEEQLAKSNEPQFQAALDSKKAAQTHSETAPKAYRQGEQSQLSQAESTAAATAQEKLQGMHGERSQSLELVTGKQVEGKGKDEQSRAKIAGDIDKIYQTTKTKVDARLAKLTTDVVSAFDAGAAEARKVFEDYVAKQMDDYKAARYNFPWDPIGWLKWAGDKLFGMPEEVNRFYEKGRDLYLKYMDGVIDKVVAIVGTGLTEAKNDVADGRKQVKDYVAKLPEDLKAIGEEAATNIQSQFDGLEQDIQNKLGELMDTLVQKYKENLDAVDARIQQMQEENKGLIQKAIDFIVGVVKTIVELAKMLLEVLARVASVIGNILKDPIGFLSNLFNALKQGFLNFVKNIGKYLLQGLLSWLTGALAGTNIQMPTSLDPEGIFNLVTQLIGLTYDNIRARAVKRLGKGGEEKVSYLEKSFELFRMLVTKGVAGIWQVLKDKLGDLKTMVLDPIIQFLTEKVITAGVMFIIGLMTPASAFIKACQSIYEIVKFFIERAQQIIDLINTILDAIGLVASGAIEKALQAIEATLAKGIPLAIGFLASLVGLGDVSAKVQAIIKKMRQPIDKAVDWVIDQGVKAYKAVEQKLQKTKLAKRVKAAKEAVRKKKEAVEKRYEQEKSKLLKSKAGKKALEALKAKRDAAKKKLDAAKIWPLKKQEKVASAEKKTSKTQGKEIHSKKVAQGLAAINQEETRYLKQGQISKENSEKVASTVKRRYPVFKVLTVIDGGETWDYNYVASPTKVQKGRKKIRSNITKKRFQRPIEEQLRKTIRKENTLEIIGRAHTSLILRQKKVTSVEPKKKAAKVAFLRHLSTVINSSSKNFQEVQAAIKGDLIYISSNSKESELPNTREEILELATFKADDNDRVKRHKEKLKEELQAFDQYKYEVVTGKQGQHAETKIITKDEDIEHIAGQRRPCAACFIFFILKDVPPEKFNPHPGPLWEAKNALESISSEFILPHLKKKFPNGAENDQKVIDEINRWLTNNEGKFRIGDTGYVNKGISAVHQHGYDTASEDESM